MLSLLKPMIALIDLNKRILLLTLAVLILSAVTAAAPVGERVTDVIVGRNSRGPYTLSWTNIDPSSVIVVVNGITLKRGEHYNIDCEKGVISFNSIVKNDAIVRVTYSTTPGKSQRNTGKVNIPVTLNVFQRQDASLQVTGLYMQDDPRNPDVGKTIVGVGGEKKWAQTKLSSQVFLSQRSEGETRTSQTSSGSGSAFRLGTESNFGALKVFGSLTQAAEGFAGTKETGIAAGKRTSEMLVTFSPDSKLQASSRLQQVENLTAAGGKSVVQEHNLVVKPSEETRIALSHTVAEASQSSSEKTVESTSVKVEQKLGSSAAATLSATTSSTAANGASEKTQSQQLMIASEKAVAQVAVQKKESEIAGETATTDVSVTAKPFANTQLKGRVLTTEQQGSTLFQREVSLVSKPLEVATLEAGFAQKGKDQDDDVTKQVKLELTPIPNTKLTAGFKYVESGPSLMTIKDYAAQMQPLKFATLSASLRQRAARADEAPDTASVQVSLAPFNYFTVTGSYQANPEDTRGQIQPFNATNLGVKFKVGNVGVTTEYTTKEEYLASRSANEAKVAVQFPAFGSGTLTTGFKTSRLLDGSLLASNTYSIGYSRGLGSTFNLSLSAYYTQYMKNRAVMPDKTEYSAELSLGIRF